MTLLGTLSSNSLSAVGSAGRSDRCASAAPNPSANAGRPDLRSRKWVANLLDQQLAEPQVGNNKRFEELRPAILAVLRRHFPDAADHTRDDDRRLRTPQLQRMRSHVAGNDEAIWK